MIAIPPAKLLSPLSKGLDMDGEYEDPGTCAECGKAYELVRPGKSQPTCECHLMCHMHDRPVRVEYRTTGQVTGYVCPVCWPEQGF
jgi:hypothetical protein